MGPKDDASAKPAEIGNALVEALGFEPADGKKVRSGTGAQATGDVSDQISEIGFSVKEVLDGAEAADEESTSIDSSSNGASEASTSSSSSNGTTSQNGTEKVDGVDADVPADVGVPADKKADGTNGSSTNVKSSSSSKSKRRKSKRNNSRNNKTATSTSTSTSEAGAESGVAGESSQGLQASAEAKLKTIVDGDPNDTVVMPGPPSEDIAAAIAGTGSKAKDKDDLVESLVAAGTIAGAAPTSPPLADPISDTPSDAESDARVDAVADTTVSAKADAKVDPSVDPGIPSSPAITGEHAVVEVDEPAVEERSVVVADARSVIDKPKSVSDMFSGGITGRRRLQARKVRRVIRHIDPWSVLTFSVLFHLCLFAALLLASVLVWNVAEEAGTIENVESFIRELGDYETFEIDGEAIFRAAVAIAGIMTLAASVLVVLLTVVFNLLSDLLGGVRVTVIEEETVRVKPKKGQ